MSRELLPPEKARCSDRSCGVCVTCVWRDVAPTAETWFKYPLITKLDADASVVCIACDACKQGIAVVRAVDPPIDVASSGHWDWSVAQWHAKKIDDWYRKFMFTDEQPAIAVAELAAIVKAVEETKQQGCLILLATDSQVARDCVENEGSHNALACELLRRLFPLLKQRGQKLQLTYIKTTVNPADEPSRKFPFVPPLKDEAVNACQALLRAAYGQATAIWELGSVTGRSQRRAAATDPA